MSKDIEMETHSQAFSEGVETATSHDEDLKSSSGLAAHTETFQTTEEKQAERRFVLKVDLMILPLLVLSVFLASLVRPISHLFVPPKLDRAITLCPGSWRYWICLYCRDGKGA